jgi:hypothetical protein
MSIARVVANREAVAPRTLQWGRGAVEKIHDRQCAGRGCGSALETFKVGQLSSTKSIG